MASKNICDDGHEGTTITRICILKSRPRCRPLLLELSNVKGAVF